MSWGTQEGCLCFDTMDPNALERLRHLPQWGATAGADTTVRTTDAPPAVVNVWSEQPQWNSPNTDTSSPAHECCSQCLAHKSWCTCMKCSCCSKVVRTGTRHHCRKCWKTVCGDCWTRSRYVRLMQAPVRVCDACAGYRGLTALSSHHLERFGVYLLRLAAELPRVCVDQRCTAVSYREWCGVCGLPTLPAAPHVERLVSLRHLCCSAGSSSACIRCKEVRFRLDAIEQEIAERAMCFMESGEAERRAHELMCPGWLRTTSVFAGAETERDTVEFLSASLCASVCYEYPAFPQITLSHSDIPIASCLHLLYCSQSYSLFRGVGNTMYVAFPGTHDARTVMTDLRFSRVPVTTWSSVHGGVVHGPFGGSARLDAGAVKLWEYKVHRGFHEESVELMKKLPPSLISRLVESGHRVVLVGHSLGGALATLVGLRHLLDRPGLFSAECLRCITFGCPLVGNSQLRRVVERCGWTSVFHHVVYRSDVVCRLGCGRELTKDVAARVQASVQSAFAAIESAFQSWWNKKSSVDADSVLGIAEDLTTPAGENSGCSTSGNDVAQLDAAIASDPLPEDGDPCEPTALSHRALLYGPQRPLDCVGTYHFLFRVVRRDGSQPPLSGTSTALAEGRTTASRMAYASTCDGEAAFQALKNSQDLNTALKDHFLDSYNFGLALLMRLPLDQPVAVKKTSSEQEVT